MRWIVRILLMLLIVMTIFIITKVKVEEKKVVMNGVGIKNIKGFQDQYKTQKPEKVDIDVNAGGADYSDEFFIEGMHNLVIIFDYEDERCFIKTLRDRIRTMTKLYEMTYEPFEEKLGKEFDIDNESELERLKELTKGIDIEKTKFEIIPVTIETDFQVWNLNIDNEEKFNIHFAENDSLKNLYIEPKGGWR